MPSGNGMPSSETGADVILACAADRTWALPLAVMLRSAEDHLRPGRTLIAHVIDGGLSSSDRERVQSSLRGPTRVLWHAPDRTGHENLPLWGHVSRSTYDRLSVARVLPPEVRRVVWLDCDVLVLDDVSQLFDAEMSGATVLAARDPFVKVVSSRYGVQAYRECGLDAEGAYFNAGVMVLDLAAWSRQEVEGRALDYLRRHASEVFFHEQEALNAVLAGHWSPLPAAWNWSAHPVHAPVAGLRGSEPAIVHFTGARKPWIHGGSGPWYRRYLEQVDATAWRGLRPSLGLREKLLLLYERSEVRALLHPIENFGMRLRRTRTRARRTLDGAP